MASSVWLLLLFLGLIGWTLQVPPEHICSKILQGAFYRIRLNSFTYHHQHLMMLESGALYGPLALDHDKLTSIPDTPTPWRDYFAINSSEINGTQLILLYSLAQTQLWIITDQEECLWSAAERSCLFRSDRVRTELALILDQAKSGFVIKSKEEDNYIMYEFDYRVGVFNWTQAGDKFLYLEKSIVPEKAVLRPSHVNRRDSPDSSHALFFTHPTGFIAQSKLYLFDTSLGCVYILDHISNFSALYNSTNIHLVNRSNVPFEDFFDCSRFGGAQMTLNRSRCNTQLDLVEFKPEPEAVHNRKDHKTLQMVLIGFVLVILLLAGLVWICSGSCRNTEDYYDVEEETSGGELGQMIMKTFQRKSKKREPNWIRSNGKLPKALLPKIKVPKWFQSSKTPSSKTFSSGQTFGLSESSK